VYPVASVDVSEPPSLRWLKDQCGQLTMWMDTFASLKRVAHLAICGTVPDWTTRNVALQFSGPRDAFFQIIAPPVVDECTLNFEYQMTICKNGRCKVFTEL